MSGTSQYEYGPVLLVPGIGNSGPDHWQSRWQERHRSFRRVQQQEWDHPVASDWAKALEAAALEAGSGAVEKPSALAR